MSKPKKNVKKGNKVIDQGDVHRMVIRELRSQEEVKVIDVFLNSSITSSALIVNTTLIPQGVGQSQRVGDRVMLLRQDIELQCNYPFSSAVFPQDMYDNVRMDKVRWKNQSNVTPITSSLIYENLPGEGIYTPFNWENRKNFSVLSNFRDFVTGFYDSAATASTPTAKSVFIHRKKGDPLNSTLVFTPGTTGGNGHIYIILLSDSAATPHPIFNLMVRTYYTDA